MKKFAPVAMLFGIFTALLVGNAAPALANPSYSCSNGVNVVTCNDVIDDVTVEIKDVRALTNNEITILQNNLNNATINILNLKNVTIDVLKDFDPSIDVDVSKITVCILSVCG